MDNSLKLGKLLDATDSHQRDAVHIAIAAVTSSEVLPPGQHVGLVGPDRVGTNADRKIGIVDPFLTEDVQPEQLFYVWLYPGTITSLRHVWSHPAFTAMALKEKA